jgi:peptide/nickel transport system ATP-binding protein
MSPAGCEMNSRDVRLSARGKGKKLLEIGDFQVEGLSDESWHPILRGIDLLLNCGNLLGLIGKLDEGKCMLGLAAMGYAKPGCCITRGMILFDGTGLRAASESQCCALCSACVVYVAQSAAAAFDPAHWLIYQTMETAVDHGLFSHEEARADAVVLYRRLQLPVRRD